MGDERCDLVATALEEIGFWPVENGQAVAVEQEIIDGIEVMQKVMEMDKPLNSRLVAVRPVLVDLQRLIDEYRDSLAGKTGRSGERPL
jgi:predicted ATP-binding protein involved in virulence